MSSPSSQSSPGTDSSEISSLSSRSRTRLLHLPPGPAAGFLGAVAALLVMASVFHSSSRTSGEAAQAVVHTNEVIARSQAILSAVKDAETGQRGYLITGNESYLEPYEAGRSQLHAAISEARRLLSDNPAQLKRISDLERLSGLKLQELEQTVALQRAGNSEGALDVVRSDRGKDVMVRIRELVADMQNDERSLLQHRQEDWQRAQRYSEGIIWLGVALLLSLIGASAVMTARDFRRREAEAWMRSALAGLSLQLRGDMPLPALGSRALAFLARLLQARVGQAYVVDGGRLRPFAAYGKEPAQDDGSHEPGLALQAAKDAKLLHASDVPQGYLRVESGTGQADPQELLIAPAMIDGKVQGVLELGFFRKLDAADLELLERASEALGVAIRASRDRSRLEELLAETQRQAEELQTQQEELRVSNEELEEQGRVLKASQAQLESQQAELEQTNVQLEEQTQVLERQKQALEQAQGDLRANAERLEAASRYKSEFLANMSHELRTPLNSALILSKLLADNREGTLTPEQVKHAQAIHSANNDLLALINDILDLSKIEAGRVDLVSEDVRVEALVERLRTTFEPLTRQKGLHFAVEAAAGAPQALRSDGQRLQQILVNLLANAVKFTQNGEVKLRIEGGTDGKVRFHVIDTGMGIPRHQQEVIFEAFRQADGSTSRRFGGTGLGLSISRELAHRMGGDIMVDSEPGRGSCFTLELPVVMPQGEQAEAPARQEPASWPPARAAHPQPEAPAAAPASAEPFVPDDRAQRKHPGRLILAVEDDRAFATALLELIRERGFDGLVARDATEALDLARRFQPNGILLDIVLPDASGLSVLERLKRDPATRHVPVHMISALDRSHTALELGAIGHLGKPATREALVGALLQIESRLQRDVRRLLIVEDDAALRANLKLLLSDGSVDITGVGSVGEALAALSSTSFDCMVTDLVLPDGSGYDLLERMAAMEDAGFPPVIVYTGRALTRDEEQRLRRYSKSIIVKGARSPERLLDEVTLFLHSVESSLPPDRQRMLRHARQRDAVLDGRRLLLAEDDVRNIFALSSVFEPLGAKLEIARNGREALERLEKEDIDLVLMDVMMPEMDGLTAMRLIRERPQWRNVPIIALTAKAMPEDRERCLQAGANDYLPKPIDVDKLVSLCRVWCPK